MKVIVRFALIFVLSALPAFAHKHETGFLDRTLKFQGNSYRYQVYVPSDYDPHQAWPVILFLHGSGERGDDGLIQTEVGIGSAIRRSRGKVQAIVVMPQLPEKKIWPDEDMSAMALAELDAAVHEFHGDTHRLYLTGLSNGGYGTWDIAATHPGKFAAIVPVCGGLHAPSDMPELTSAFVRDPKVTDPYAEVAKRIGSTATAVWIFHGADDPVVSVEESRKMAAALRAAGASVKYTEFPATGHNAWDQAYAEPGLFDWMLAHSLAHADNKAAKP